LGFFGAPFPFPVLEEQVTGDLHPVKRRLNMALNKNTEEKWTETAPVLHVDPPTGSRKGAHQSSRARYFQKSLAI